jgi:hypothetical protein
MVYQAVPYVGMAKVFDFLHATNDALTSVLRPHGVLVLADIANIREYRTYLTSKGVTDMRTVLGGAEAVIMGALSGGSYRPQALLALRP